MGIFSFALPTHIALVAVLAAFLLLLRSARLAPWKRLTEPGVFSPWCGFIIMLPLIWQFGVPVASGTSLHLLGMPLFVLMFGGPLALLGISLSIVAYTFLHDGLWSNVGMNVLLLGVVPAYCGELVMRATRRFLPPHLFVYLLGNGLFGAFAMMCTIGLVSMAAHTLWGASVSGDAIAYMLLLSWGEAILTGFLLTVFTVYRPECVLTFDDEVYLSN